MTQDPGVGSSEEGGRRRVTVARVEEAGRLVIRGVLVEPDHARLVFGVSFQWCGRPEDDQIVFN